MRIPTALFLLGLTACSSVSAGSFQNPINGGADPWLEFYRGNYYLTSTQDSSIKMWTAPTLAELKSAKPHVVWEDKNPSRSRGIWAPEFHLINGHWYLYYTATTADGVDDRHRLYVLESDGKNPLGPYHYKNRLFSPDNDHYAIDPTVFKNEQDSQYYLLWAARPGHVLTIAHLANPYTLDGNGVTIPSEAFGCHEVHEGPEVLQHDGKIFLVYSMCGASTPDYKLGMLVANAAANVLDPKSWVQFPCPVFERNDAIGVYGPGHNGFFKSPDGKEDWIVYHAKTTTDNIYRDRTTRAQKFAWNADGTPNFGTPLPLSAEIQEPSK